MDSVLLSTAQITRLNAVHFKSLRRIFKIKPSYYHRILNPTDAECSNEYLAGLAYSSKRVVTPSQLYLQQRLKLLGHLLRHPDSIESQSSFMPSGAYRFIPGPNRVGRPRLHWAESCMAEAANRIDYLLSDNPPLHSDIHISDFSIPSTQEVLNSYSSQSVVWMDNTLLFRKVRTFAFSRVCWFKLLNKPKRANFL